VDWIRPAEDRYQWQALRTWDEPFGSIKGGNFSGVT
jgi:hypothetical protein